jgi:hypothetical protein
MLAVFPESVDKRVVLVDGQLASEVEAVAVSKRRAVDIVLSEQLGGDEVVHAARQDVQIGDGPVTVPSDVVTEYRPQSGLDLDQVVGRAVEQLSQDGL